jgi:hypothetical protein
MMVEPKHISLIKLRDYWRTKAGDRSMPSRADIDPAEIRALLPHVGLIEIGPSPQRFQFRLVRTEVVRAVCLELTGHYLDEIDLHDHRARIIEQYAKAANSAEPVCSIEEYTLKDGRHLRYERMLLPLSNDGKSVDMLLGGCVFDIAYG